MADISFDQNGLAPCVVQDHATGEVLMLAYMNQSALGRTLESGEMHFWSRSRSRLWLKGETSGNRLKLIELRYDCDADALLALVVPAGPACHTGERSCFYRSITDRAVRPYEVLPELSRVIESRYSSLSEGSYTTELFNGGVELMGAKVEEEAEEVVRAAASESDERVAEEAADLIYHVLVLVRSRGLSLEVVLEQLGKRMK